MNDRIANAKRRAEIGNERRARTRENILNAAFETIGRERGRLSRVEEICSVAGISRANFYNYFSDLDQLLLALVHDLSHEFNIAMLASLEDIPGFAERTAAAIRFHLIRANEDPQWGWAMVNISAGGYILGAESFRRATMTVREAEASGELVGCPPEIAVDLTVGSTLAAMMRILREVQDPQFPEQVARQILIAIGIEPERANAVSRLPLPTLPDYHKAGARG